MSLLYYDISKKSSVKRLDTVVKYGKMNPQIQNQPDFNFIMSQPGPEDKPVKKRSPLVWLFAALLVLGVLAVVALLFISPSQQVQNSAFPVTDTSDAFVAYITDGQYDKAYELLTGETKSDIEYSEYASLAAQQYANIDVQNCKRTSPDLAASQDGAASIVDYDCPVKEGSSQVIISFVMVDEGGQTKIGNIMMAVKATE